ncbi:MAG: pit accessory protein [Verrucomicrobia bacterium]|nr:pit accessory protein [Verrucomicrobiota bacterium]
MFSLQKLLGKEDKFFDLLEAAVGEACASVRALAKFTHDPEQTRTLNEFIASKHKEKAIASKISDELCTTFVTALEREDIEALSTAMYRIPKTIMKIGERILLGPDLVRGLDLTRQLVLMEKATDTLMAMMKELRKGARLEQIKNHNDDLQAIEAEADRMLLDLLKCLYSGKTEPVQLIFLKDLFDLLENVTDRCRDAGNVIVHISLKNS